MNIDEVETIIGQENLNNFMVFMKGQTVGIDERGLVDYYEIDVQTFINSIKRRQ